MKIKILHPAQTANSKNAVRDHKPGDQIETDEAQASRLIAAGYAAKVNGDEADAPEPIVPAPGSNLPPPPST